MHKYRNQYCSLGHGYQSAPSLSISVLKPWVCYVEA